jgi:hypothetical protein
MRDGAQLQVQFSLSSPARRPIGGAVQLENAVQLSEQPALRRRFDI